MRTIKKCRYSSEKCPRSQLRKKIKQQQTVPAQRLLLRPSDREGAHVN